MNKVELEQQKIQLVLQPSVSEKMTTDEGVALKPVVNIVTHLKIFSAITVNSRCPLA